MTTTVAEILARIGTRFPLSKAAAWDTPLGLQFGDPVAPVQRLAVCHEITEAVTAVVERDPVDLIVAGGCSRTGRPTLANDIQALFTARLDW